MSSATLWERFQQIPDPRGGQGIRYSLPSMLGLVMAAILSGRTTLRAIARWGKSLSQEQLLELDIHRGRAPCQTALHDLFDKLAVSHVEEATGAWVADQLGGQAPGHIALDGKTLRASKGADYPALHLLAAFCVAVHGVLRQEAVADKANEITAAKAMLGRLSVAGAVVTGDAMFCQKELCRRIVEGGGDFLFTVKGNQSGLMDDAKTTFAAAFSPGDSWGGGAAHHGGKAARSPGSAKR